MRSHWSLDQRTPVDHDPRGTRAAVIPISQPDALMSILFHSYQPEAASLAVTGTHTISINFGQPGASDDHTLALRTQPASLELIIVGRETHINRIVDEFNDRRDRIIWPPRTIRAWWTHLETPQSSPATANEHQMPALKQWSGHQLQAIEQKTTRATQ